MLAGASFEAGRPSGTGSRYTGEQQFYVFNVGMGTNLPTGADPWIFNQSLNIILESRAAYLNSTVGNSSKPGGGIGAIDGLPCLSGSTVTTRSGSNGSQVASAATWQADLSASSTTQSSAVDLLYWLQPLNATGNRSAVSAHKGWLELNTTQVELLGLNSQSLALVPFVVPLAQQTVSSSPPVSLQSRAGSWVAQAWNDIQGALVAFGNFLVTVYHYLQTVGQWVVGFFQAAASAVSKAVSAAVSAIESWLSALVSLARQLLVEALSGVIHAIDAYCATLSIAMSGGLTDMTGGGLAIPGDVISFWANFTSSMFLYLLAASVAILIVVVIVSALSLGADFLAADAVGVILGGIVAVSFAAFAANFLPTNPDTSQSPGRQTISDLNYAANSSGLNSGQTGQGSYSSFSALDVLDYLAMGWILIADALSAVTTTILIFASYEPGTANALQAAYALDFTLAFISLILDYYAQTSCNLLLSVGAVLFGGIAFLYSYHLRRNAQDELQALDDTSLTASGVGVALGLAQIAGRVGAGSGC